MAGLLHCDHHNNDNDYDYEIDDYGKQYHDDNDIYDYEIDDYGKQYHDIYYNGGNEHHNYYNNIDDIEADVEVENNYIILANNLIKII